MSGILSNVHGNISFALNLHYKAMARLQEQAYTGSRINRASDEPSTAYLILGLNSQKRTLGNYMDNIADTMSSLEIASEAVSNMVESISKAKVVLAGVTDTGGTIAQSIYPDTINSLLEDLVLSANWQHRGQYLFGGSDTDSAPYKVTRSGGSITKVAYQGSLEDRDIEVAPNVESSAFYVGDNVFHSNDRDDPEFVLDNTGAAAGTGTASVTGYAWLTVSAAVNEKQTITITGGPPTSGNINIAFGGDNVNVAFGADADAVRLALQGLSSIGVGDVTVTGTSFTDADGITIEFTGALALTNVAEMVVADVDLNNGATPAISTDRDGGMQFSIDGGTAVGIPIGDKTNVAVTNPDGKVLYVNATNITSTGVDIVNIPGTHDIFNTLITIRDILINENDTFTSGQLNTLRDNSTEALDELSGLLSEMTVSLGTRIGFLETIKDNLEDMKFGVEDEATLLEQADIAQIAIGLSRRQALYEMSLSVAGRIMSVSLLDFIR